MPALRVLIADDNAADRLILKAMLERMGHKVFAAEDGVQAVLMFQQISPDLVLLDALMPAMDGRDAAIRIKAASGERLIPIIFLTSLQEAEALAELIEVGGDDFLTKPYNRQLLKAKVSAFVRLKDLYQTIRDQRDQIQYHTDRLIHEQEMAKIIFDNIAHPGCLADAHIRYNLKPKSIFNGDILLAARRPAGALHILLGDFTGHGLQAAVGAMPLADIFYSMTWKGYGFAEILREINTKLVRTLPTEVFCCLIAAEMDPRESLLRVWNCGMPTAYLLRPGEGPEERFESMHLPLGIQMDCKTDSIGVSVRMESGDRLFMASDGVVEAENGKGQFFGEVRLMELMDSYKDTPCFIDPLMDELTQFLGGRSPLDDVSVVEVDNRFEAVPETGAPRLSIGSRQRVPDWHIVYELRAQTLSQWDPLPFILHILMETPGLAEKRSQIYTILSELYANALDHGVLGLSSALKASPEGFTHYYNEREWRLSTLQDGYVRFGLEQKPTPDGGKLIIRIEDSGKGYDWKNYVAKLSNTGFSGRGLALLHSLCGEFHVEGSGNIACASISWRFSEADGI